MADQNIMCEVEIQPDIQECVEIESIPVDMPCENVETIVECVGVEPMISLQTMGNRDEIILQPQEEIIDDSGDPLNVYDEIPVPDSEIYIESSPGPSKRKKNLHVKNNRGILIKRENEMFGINDMPMETKSRKWEQKQVQIKTMEGEFSVTMWASGTDDGKSSTINQTIQPCFESKQYRLSSVLQPIHPGRQPSKVNYRSLRNTLPNTSEYDRNPLNTSKSQHQPANSSRVLTVQQP